MKSFIAFCVYLTFVGCSTVPDSGEVEAFIDKAELAALPVQIETCRKIVRTGSNIPKQECTTRSEREQERASSRDVLERDVFRPNTAPTGVK